MARRTDRKVGVVGRKKFEDSLGLGKETVSGRQGRGDHKSQLSGGDEGRCLRGVAS